MKVSRSFIVHIDAVTRIIPWFNRRLLLKFERSKKKWKYRKTMLDISKRF
ncbi:hypothetical protein CAI16_12085 [Virgibacillus dokdonensis]|uniref:HTH LytTR-type domain-containing protein n=1 Tax=Virgibacillus dokdonensis TaxID=302167 RepID=A0A3E0WMR8_9BACI|nr:hypothetical protein CAI16_12085 [Virgibacillus dokdonensis]